MGWQSFKNITSFFMYRRQVESTLFSTLIISFGWFTNINDGMKKIFEKVWMTLSRDEAMEWIYKRPCLSVGDVFYPSPCIWPCLFALYLYSCKSDYKSVSLSLGWSVCLFVCRRVTFFGLVGIFFHSTSSFSDRRAE